MQTDIYIQEPDDPQLDQLCRELFDAAERQQWPAEQLLRCAQRGVFRWFLSHRWGGWNWDELATIQGYLKLSTACLTTTFVITQRTAACRRIQASENETLKQCLLPDLATGRTFATVGISHLTTSRRHLAQPVLRAAEVEGGFQLDGYSPWVTGASKASTIVVGATMEDGREVLLALDPLQPQVEIPPRHELVGLSASETGPVICHRAWVPRERLIAGPAVDVMRSGEGANTGGLQTSTLALGLARAAIDYVAQQAVERPNLKEVAGVMDEQWNRLCSDLFQRAEGDASTTAESLRSSANSLVLRSTQAALTAAKGAGYVDGHPVGRWCREALFFLVWSCPQGVASSNLCELAGIG